MALFDEVKELIVKELSVEADKVTPEAEFTNDLNADSLDVVELIMALEEKFGVEIPDEEANKISKVGDVVAFIEANKK
ncbi:acyl carrier protein [Helicobacter sp. T3_23-1059]